jgi:hypothetical protein
MVTDKTKLEEDHRPLVVGACVEVEYEGNVVEDIASEKQVQALNSKPLYTPRCYRHVCARHYSFTRETMLEDA